MKITEVEENMESTRNIFTRVFEKMEKGTFNEENGDYISEKDGLIYCGLCHTPKQQISEIGGSSRKIPKNCACRQKEIDKERHKWQELEHQRIVSDLREEAFEDKLLQNQTFEKEDGSLEHRKIGENYIKKFEKMEKENIGLLLTGPVGTGKTYLASSIANALIEQEISVKMTNFAIILNDMMNLEINKNKYITNLNRYRLLIIDDFGMERDTPFATEHIFNIIDSRYRANKPLILTSNLSAAQLTAPSNLKEQRIYSRILEMAIPVLFTGENRRLTKMKEKAKMLNTMLMEEQTERMER